MTPRVRIDYIADPSHRSPRLGDSISVDMGQQIGQVVAIRLDEGEVVATIEIEAWEPSVSADTPEEQ